MLRPQEAFYLHSRMTLMHWLCSPATKVDKTTPYKGNESTKLNALLAIIIYHQSERGAGPLMNDPDAPDDDRNRLTPDTTASRPPGTKAVPDPNMPVDKIVGNSKRSSIEKSLSATSDDHE